MKFSLRVIRRSARWWWLPIAAFSARTGAADGEDVCSSADAVSAGQRALIFASTPTLDGSACPNLGYAEACGKPGTPNADPSLWDAAAGRSNFTTFWPPECGCFPPEDPRHPCACVLSEDMLGEGFSLGDNEYKDRHGCYASAPNPLTSIFDTTAWCFVRDDTACPGAQPSLAEAYNLDGTRANLPGVRVCGAIGDDCSVVGRVDDSCAATSEPLAFSGSGNHSTPDDTRLPLLEQMKPEARAAFDLVQDEAPLNGRSMTEYINDALATFGPGPEVCGDTGNWNTETSESVQNITRCQGNFVLVLPRSWILSDPNNISDDGYGSVEARASSLWETIGQGEQAFPGELFNGRNWTTLSGDTMVAATPSCATPGGEVQEGTANFGDFQNVTATEGGFPGKVWRPLAESATGCCPCTPCLRSGRCLSQTAIGDGVQFAVAKTVGGGPRFKGKLAYWILTWAGQVYLTEPVPPDEVSAAVTTGDSSSPSEGSTDTNSGANTHSIQVSSALMLIVAVLSSLWR